jgi:adenylosuccinate synthase
MSNQAITGRTKSADSAGLTFVVGLQYGSEAKGSITNYLAPGADLAIRTGAANAGHTFYYEGKAQIMRQLPAAWTNRYAELAIGIGAVISPTVLLREIENIERKLPIKHRLAIDPQAHVITEDQIIRESQSDLGYRIGSTSARAREGIGTATADKVLRLEGCVQAKDYPAFKPFLKDTVELVNATLDDGSSVLVEGSQGFGISLEHGHFPYVTSRDTTVSALAASIGVSPHHYRTRVVGVARSYPIRTNGNTGPFDEDSVELTWNEVAKRAASPEVFHERTTVTNQVRRIATFSMQGFLRACLVNRPTDIALTFADYIDWAIHNREEITKPVTTFIDELECAAGIPVTIVTTGPATIIKR